MVIPRIMIAAPGSGSGKTLITCGILQGLINRGQKAISFKCGPDYIDPMFHARVIGSKSRNLDSFFTQKDILRFLLAENSAGFDIAVLEGVMGYYDGIAGTTTRGSAYEVASLTDTPAVLVINARGMSLSAAALAAGFAGFRKNSRIRGVILNQISPMLYPRMKEQIEKETGLFVYGYLPVIRDCFLDSRHLGLVLPEEVEGLKEKIYRLSEIMNESIDFKGLLSLASEAPDRKEEYPKIDDKITKAYQRFAAERLCIAVARDEAFCFFYEDNLTLLEKMGAKLIEFSPLHDKTLPAGMNGILLNGGYPELHAPALSANISMRESIREKVYAGLPVIAECGGFLYLHEYMEDMEKKKYPMAGVISGRAYPTGKLSRFGYVTLSGGKVFGRDIGAIPAHEFHYYDSTENGTDFTAQKPKSSRNWQCVHATDSILMGFPHYYFYGNMALPEAFLEACAKYKRAVTIKENIGEQGGNI